MTCKRHQSMTPTEKAKAALEALWRTDDVLPDNNDVDEATHLLGDLVYEDFASPYCEQEGCLQPVMDAFPWCPWHRPESYGPLPEGFPSYPGTP